MQFHFFINNYNPFSLSLDQIEICTRYLIKPRKVLQDIHSFAEKKG